ncbi:hypothetical protein ElyMa_006911600 [Elysia marginata]|uniref:Secreted protein n=1 Tax=Elysia marginata TaxID=1093978 RepID=A0AAV4JDP0_9GAST|nr:hypothetical protein ElyMa_006911600 [Elysia marginata]
MLGTSNSYRITLCILVMLPSTSCGYNRLWYLVKAQTTPPSKIARGVITTDPTITELSRSTAGGSTGLPQTTVEATTRSKYSGLWFGFSEMQIS